MKKLFNPWFVLLTLVLLVALKVANPSFIEIFNLKSLDLIVEQKKETPKFSDHVVIVEIGEADLKALGPWPFPRQTWANLISTIGQAQPAVIAIPVAFGEKDRFGGDQHLRDIMNVNPNVVLAQLTTNQTRQVTPVGERFAFVGEDPLGFAFQWPGAIRPTDKLLNAGGIGTVATAPEKDGVVRRIPFIVGVNEEVYPSFALEALRVASGNPSSAIKTTEAGIEAIKVPNLIKIDTDQHGRVWIDYNNNFVRVPYSSVTPEKKELFANKVVIIAPRLEAVGGIIATPRGEMWAHDIQAHAIATALNEVSIKRFAYADLLEAIFVCIIGLCIIVVAPRVPVKFFAPTIISVLVATYYGSVYRFQTNQELWDPIFPMFAFTIIFGHVLLNNFAREFLQKLQIKKQFGTYLSPAMVEKLQKNPELLALGGDSRELSIMFTDVRGFTTISEHYGADVQGLTKIMNRYMTAMTKKIIDNNGTLDKYIGDAQMAFWNAPLDDPNHAKNAVRTAIEMMESLDAFNAEIAKEGIPAFGMGLGINTGTVVVGNMGSDQRFDYTCLGDSVNLASRLEGQSKPYGVKMIIGALTAEQIKDEYSVIELDCIAVKGKTEGVKIFTIGETVNYKHDMYLEAYYRGDWKRAIKIAKELSESTLDIKQYYLNMIERMEEGLPANWDGTFRATSK